MSRGCPSAGRRRESRSVRPTSGSRTRSTSTRCRRRGRPAARSRPPSRPAGGRPRAPATGEAPAAAPSCVLPSSAVEVGTGTQTEGCRRCAGRWVADAARTDRNRSSACSKVCPSAASSVAAWVVEIWVAGGAGCGGRRCPRDGERLHPQQPVDRRPERRRRRRPQDHDLGEPGRQVALGRWRRQIPAWTSWSEVAGTAESSPCWRMPRAVAGTAVSGSDATPAISVANRAPVLAEA